ncbi:Hypothetical protein GLP15_381 [Giardia lamblia P15]|uniref:Uncharacterized protein n=1 Tax=Giardia intestinalis (strain P15) TaxID=658858 RepID=E1EXR9_GIAIA|nr:Hypothetical protein GLP15_381 [Giardia lamblia P15]
MASENMVRWLFVGPSDVSTASYVDSINSGRPILTTSVEGSNVQVTLDQVSLNSDTTLAVLAERLNTHFTDIIIAIYDSNQEQTKPLLEGLLSLKNLPQSCFLCDTNVANEDCMAIEHIAAPYISPGYSFHYIHVSNKDSNILKSCLLRATKYCLQRRQIMLLNLQAIHSEITEGIQSLPTESSSPAVSLSPSGAVSQVTQKLHTKRAGTLNIMSPVIQSSPTIDQRTSSQSLSIKDSSKFTVKLPSTHIQEELQRTQDVPISYDPMSNFNSGERKAEDPNVPKEFDLPVDIGNGTEALFHGFIGQDPGEAMLQFMQKNNVSSRDYVMLYDKIKRLMIKNGYLSDEDPIDPQEQRSIDTTEKGKLIFSTNILFGSKKIKIDFYETDTSEEVARRTVQSLGLGQNYEVFLRKKIDVILNSMKK